MASPVKEINFDNSVDDHSSKDLNVFVQNLLRQMQDRFEEMSQNIVGRIDDMGIKNNL